MSEMDKIELPPVAHLCIIVKDLNKAVEYFSSNFDIGPFRIIEASRKGATIHGIRGDYKLKLAFGKFGPVELEIEQVLEGKPIQGEFIEAKGEGLHHLGFYVDDLDAEIAKYKKRGFNITQQSPPGSESRFAFVDTEKVGGMSFELVQRPKG